jgi:nitroreductase
MDFFEAVKRRRSIRRFTSDPVPDEVVRKALEAAVLAPNSSNTQTWNFYWIKSPEMRKKVVEACLSQSAARTSQQLIVVTCDPKLWRRSLKPLQNWVKSVNAPKDVVLYYDKIIPLSYTWGILNCLAPLKWLAATLVGFFRPMTRTPLTKRDLQEVAIKSAALAAENLVLAISAQGYASCMMEGLDERRMSRSLKLRWNERVVMAIGIGREAERGTWGPQFRLDLNEVVKEL